MTNDESSVAEVSEVKVNGSKELAETRCRNSFLSGLPNETRGRILGVVLQLEKTRILRRGVRNVGNARFVGGEGRSKEGMQHAVGVPAGAKETPKFLNARNGVRCIRTQRKGSVHVA